MTPTEAIASIRASIAAGYSPSLSDIEVLIAECGRAGAAEGMIPDWDHGFPCIAVRASWLLTMKPAGYRDWGCKQCASESVFAKGDFTCAFHRAEEALTTQSPRNENG